MNLSTIFRTEGQPEKGVGVEVDGDGLSSGFLSHQAEWRRILEQEAEDQYTVMLNHLERSHLRRAIEVDILGIGRFSAILITGSSPVLRQRVRCRGLV